MDEIHGLMEAETPSNKKDVYRNPDYVTLYRYENPNVPYDEEREGGTSKKSIIGAWYTDDRDLLKTYMVSKIQGKEGGRFVTVRINRNDLPKYEASEAPEIEGLDFDHGNYIIPNEVASTTRVETKAPFKETWRDKLNIMVSDYGEIEEFIAQNLSDDSIVSRLTE